MALEVVILAAGQGSRMQSALPKVLHPLGGRPLLEHVICTALALQPAGVHVVVNEDFTNWREHFAAYPINWWEQRQQLGTGDAVRGVIPHLSEDAQVLVLYGDVPLVTPETLQQLLLQQGVAELTLLSVEVVDPRGFGRIVRDEKGEVAQIVEERDATPLQRQLREINSGILVATCELLQRCLPRLDRGNAQGEYYLTDVVKMLRQEGGVVSCWQSNQPEELLGVNDQAQLARLERYYQRRLAKELGQRGVRIIDPDRFDLRGELTVGRNVVIDINVVLEGQVVLGDGVTVGPGAILKDVQVGNQVTIQPYSVVEGAVIADHCAIGPFARIRPETHLATGAKVGNFVEIKQSKLGAKSKVNHLSYIGDAEIGERVNVGAGTITCNYDGVAKYRTIIEDGVFIGSNTALIAPVKVAAGATIGAGSVITQDAPACQLTLARAPQVTIENWVSRHRSQKLVE